MSKGNSKDKPVEDAMEKRLREKEKAYEKAKGGHDSGNHGEFKIHKATVHLKHTGTELICDVLGFHENEQALTLRDPCVLTSVPTESGKSAMALVPFLMTCKENVIHIAVRDILFVADTRKEIADQHTQMHSSIIQPPKSNLIVN